MNYTTTSIQYPMCSSDGIVKRSFRFASLPMKIHSCLVIFALVSTATAQTWRGSVTGILIDASQARVPSVEVTLTQDETNRKRVQRTDAQGEYTFSALPPGSYRLEVAKESFRAFSQELTLNVNESARIDVVLQPGSQGERTEVSDVVEPLKRKARVWAL